MRPSPRRLRQQRLNPPRAPADIPEAAAPEAMPMRRNRKKKADGAGTSTKTIPQDKDYWNITEVIKRLQAISTQCGMPVLVETQNKHQDMKTLREWMAKLMISTGEHDSARLMTEEGFFRYLRHRVTAHENRLKASETAAM